MKRLIVHCLLLLVPFAGNSRQPDSVIRNIFNLNTDNGLPDNYMYGLTVDDDGYLWLATEKGVVKYNGYECKTFGLANGLPVESNWQVFNDNKNRIWLGNLSNEMGYISKDVYHKAFFYNNNRTIYPVDITATGKGITFYSRHAADQRKDMFCIEKNDTVTRYFLPESVYAPGNSSDKYNIRNGFIIFVAQDGRFFALSSGRIFSLTARQNGSMNATFQCSLDKELPVDFIASGRKFVSGHMLLLESLVRGHKFIAVNVDNGSVQEFDIRTWCNSAEEIVYLYQKKVKWGDRYFYVFTNHHILQFFNDGKISFLKKYDIKDLSNDDIDGSNINALFIDTFWGSCLSTNNNGLFIRYDNTVFFKKENIPLLQNNIYVGGRANDIEFWWSATGRKIACVEAAGKVTYVNTELQDIKKVTKVIPYTRDSFMVISSASGEISWFNRKSKKLVPAPDMRISAGMAIFDNPACYYYISLGHLGRVTLAGSHSTFDIIDDDRYNDIVYDRIERKYWAYNDFKVTTVDSARRKAMYNRDNLPHLGVSNVDKIVIDSMYGNIFIKGYDVLSLYDPVTDTHRSLLDQLYLKGATIFIYGNKLVMIGKFGVLFCLIRGKGVISEPVIYYNRKNTIYKRTYDVQISWNRVLFRTEKGFYSVAVPGDKEFENLKQEKTNDHYKFLIYYRNEIVNSKNGDTVVIDQKKDVLHFEIINPYGNGLVKYVYKTDSDPAWHELNSNEFLPPIHIIPGNYYHLLLQAHDDVWKSEIKELQLYIKPYWWQKVFYNRFFWPMAVLTLFELVAVTVFITRKIVVKNNIKKNMRLELELKSVYSQINPHFVFNSLSTIMYFIKKNELSEAYSHVGRFSRLLRAYLDSSRKKYITIASEIENLENYIQLQQSRFEDQFDYVISVDPEINAAAIKIPALLLQPVVENAIDHGLFHKEGKGFLKIEFKRNNSENELLCIIDDDGVGRKVSKALSRKSVVKTESYGELLIADLVTVFNKYEKMKIAINYIDKEAPLTGTTVIISIKYLQHEN